MLLFVTASAYARGWRGGSGHLIPLWQIGLTVALLLIVAVIWRAHAGKLIALALLAVLARELLNA
ncbi:hypothetical protein J2W32_004452 [Variovorax boronicumulans]|uniref:Uncharacterized protein n=1 Tax=Variovorax boronicumulans TaxID=436515 RepID=A0AAW8D547_9BURK|nr:hypothetical protein [Variovorax boronicumulans]MDP9895354.1 hypothetical protein [Variovorax boronicumulans]MDQ0055394.1 hypothetical protein [Variovorax boronicumulans]